MTKFKIFYSWQSDLPGSKTKNFIRDCIDDARELESMIVAEGGNKCALFTTIGMIIGSHAGPGTIALFFLASGR